MKVLVTGAAGMIGSHLCERLLAEGIEVDGIDNFDPYYSVEQKKINAADAGVVHFSDITDRDHIDRCVEAFQPDCVVHLAAMASVRYSIGKAALYNRVNVEGSINVLDAAVKHGVKSVVFGSTSSVYGSAWGAAEHNRADRPLAPYPASKRVDCD